MGGSWNLNLIDTQGLKIHLIKNGLGRYWLDSAGTGQGHVMTCYEHMRISRFLIRIEFDA
jgi:hypothetical protein